MVIEINSVEICYLFVMLIANLISQDISNAFIVCSFLCYLAIVHGDVRDKCHTYIYPRHVLYVHILS